MDAYQILISNEHLRLALKLDYVNCIIGCTRFVLFAFRSKRKYIAIIVHSKLPERGLVTAEWEIAPAAETPEEWSSTGPWPLVAVAVTVFWHSNATSS
jgi:hypothetical protein